MTPFEFFKKVYNKGPINSFLLINEIFLRKFGISLYSYLKKNEFDKNVVHESGVDEFNYIYKSNLWGSKESVSGKGSELSYTKNYVKKLDFFLKKYEIKSIFDAPCGDLNWINETILNNNLKYIGGDIVTDIVEQNKINYKDLEFINFDLTKDKFPEVDLWHCRDCFFHLSYKDIINSLRNFVNSNISYALITNHSGLLFKNVNIKTGGFRFLDFKKKPFNFSNPNYQIKDYFFLRDFPRYVCLWKREDISKFIKNINY